MVKLKNIWTAFWSLITGVLVLAAAATPMAIGFVVTFVKMSYGAGCSGAIKLLGEKEE